MNKTVSSRSASVDFKLGRLKQLVANGESLLRWIDVYAAENAYTRVLHVPRVTPDQAALVFDLALVLSFASSRGEAGLDLEGLQRYRSLVVFSWTSFDDQTELAKVLKTLAETLDNAQLTDDSGSDSDSEGDSHSDGDSACDSRKLRLDIVFAEGRWWLARHASLQNTVEKWIKTRLDRRAVTISRMSDQMTHYVQRLFEFDGNDLTAKGLEGKNPQREAFDHQALAAAHALLSDLVLVSGGPGTGKTTTAAKLMILRLLQEQITQPDNQPLRAVCLAPTGKAAQRLATSLRAQSLSLIDRLSLAPDLEQALITAIPDEGMTIHRYLIECGKPMDELSSFVRVSDNQLVFGAVNNEAPPTLVVIDESSMIDLALMERLVAALDDKTCVVFMGDPFQLPPVEVGQVFSDWVARFRGLQTGEEQQQLLATYLPYSQQQVAEAIACGTSVNVQPYIGLNPLVQLHKSYRFEGVLAELALIVRDGAMPQLEAFCLNQAEQDVQVHWLEDQEQELYLANIVQAYAFYGEAVARKASLAELQEVFDRYQILCSTRLGPLGTVAINERVNAQLERHCSKQWNKDLSNRLFHGQAILIEMNYPALDIYNGDVGFVIEDEQGRITFQFYRGGHLPPLVVPSHKLSGYSLAYALTVHKSQGSEYRSVAVVVAPYATELVSRRLLYTGVTRSKETLSLFAPRHMLSVLFES